MASSRSVWTASTVSCSSILASAQYLNSSTSTSAPPASITYPNPTGVSTSYTSTSYNYALASTYLPNTDFSDERLAFLWDQVGPIATGILTTTVSPTPEPSSFANPRLGLHPYVPSYQPNLTNAKLPENFIWGVASSAYQVEVSWTSPVALPRERLYS